MCDTCLCVCLWYLGICIQYEVKLCVYRWTLSCLNWTIWISSCVPQNLYTESQSSVETVIFIGDHESTGWIWLCFWFFSKILWYPEYMYTWISICNVYRYMVFYVSVSFYFVMHIFHIKWISQNFPCQVVYLSVQKNIFKNRQPSPH